MEVESQSILSEGRSRSVNPRFRAPRVYYHGPGFYVFVGRNPCLLLWGGCFSPWFGEKPLFINMDWVLLPGFSGTFSLLGNTGR